MTKFSVGKFMLSFITTCLIISCSANKKDIDELVKLSDSKGLIDFIKNNYIETDSITSGIVDYAINMALQNKMVDTFDELENMYFNSSPSKHKSVIISSFANNGQTFKDSINFIDFYISNVLKDTTDYSKDKKFIETVILNYKNSFVEAAILKSVSKEITKVNYILAFEILSQYKKLGLNLNEDQLYTLSLLKQIAFFEKGKSNSFSSFESILEIDRQIKKSSDRYDKLINQKSSEKKRIINENSNLLNNSSRLEDEVDQLNNSVDKLDYFWLNGYIVHQNREFNGSIEYEISTYGWNHAYLITSTTKYSSKGTFNLRVRKTGTVTVKLKEEFGGFDQEWDVYVEVPQSKFDERDRKMSVLNEKKLELKALKNRLKSVEMKISNLNKEEITLKGENGHQFLQLTKNREIAVDALRQNHNKLLFELKKMSAIIF